MYVCMYVTVHVSGDLVDQLDIITVLVNNSSRLAIRNQPIRVHTKHSYKKSLTLLGFKVINRKASIVPLEIGYLLLNFRAMLCCRGGGNPKSYIYMCVNGS